MSEKNVLITLPAALAQFVQSQIDSGHFRTESDVVSESLRLLEEKKRQNDDDLVEVKRKIAVGLDQIRRGEVVDGEEFFAIMEKQLR